MNRVSSNSFIAKPSLGYVLSATHASTNRCPAPRRCCTSCQRCTWAGSAWRRCSRSCLGFCGERWAPGSGADQHNRQSCTVCLKTWLGETHKAVVTLILFMHLDTTIWTWWRPCGTYWFKAFCVYLQGRISSVYFHNRVWNFWCFLLSFDTNVSISS